MMTLLPPNRTAFEISLADMIEHSLSKLPLDRISLLWNPWDCPVEWLPWLAWGVSIDRWDANWSEVQKRTAIANALPDQMKKGTRAALRTVIDRFDPLIRIVEWFEMRPAADPHTFLLELPLAAQSDVLLNEAAVAALLADIAAVKPVRSHMSAAHRLTTQIHVWLIGGAHVAGTFRHTYRADRDAALDPTWLTYLETEDGEPIRSETGEFLKVD